MEIREVPMHIWIHAYRRCRLSDMSDVTRILDQIQQGDRKAAKQLLPLVYDELRKLAALRMAQEKAGQTLQATALVHEAYLRLVGTQDPGWNSAGHFFAAAAEAMRRIVLDRARDKRRLKRGGAGLRVEIDLGEIPDRDSGVDLLAFNEALEQLERDEPDCANLVKLRYFAGLGQREAAKALGLAPRTADRRWDFARAWLYDQLRRGE
jgi:RNA polymerase sigma factor (TIGR02999 family)